MKQSPQEMLNGITTRSPGLICFTSEPTSSTMPIGSCPRMSPSSMNGARISYRWRSEPQIAVDVTRTIASVGSLIDGSGTSSTRTSRLPWNVRAFISASSLHAGASRHSLTSLAPGQTGYRAAIEGSATAIPAPSGAPSGSERRAARIPEGPEAGVLRQTIEFHRDPLGFLRGQQARYGDVFSIRLLTIRPLIVAADPDAMTALAGSDPSSAHAGEARRR